MIEINLLPEQRKKKTRQAQLPKLDLGQIPVLKIMAGFLVILLVLQTALFFIGIYCRINLTSLNAKYKKILPEKQEADRLKAMTDSMSKKVKSIDDLMENRLDWARKLSDLDDCLTPGVWLSALSYDEEAVERPIASGSVAITGKAKEGKIKTESAVVRRLLLSGYALTMGEEGTSLIGRFIKSLKDNSDFYSDFGKIELGSIKRDRFDKQEVMNFRILCFFKENR
ncbi:MAG: hypothetical protein PHP46_00120 [Candidatus Omnitrophica bacterium]|nr:hypothetical protein [Candidatus Omnitrophota bacterium]